MSTGATAKLCQTLVASARHPLPEPARLAAERSLLNVVGTTVGAARSDAVEALLRYAETHGDAPTVPVLGRPEGLDPHLAAVTCGVAAHYDDFDDTHLETVIHPSAACLSALLAVGIPEGSSGEQALRAFALGCEAQLRIGVAMSPEHYDAGWHITGTCGVLGAAVTAGLLLDLDEETLEHAIGLAACQTLGVREAFGTMTKPFHPGKAGANGVLAARLAAAGLTGPTDVLERDGGFFEAMSTRATATTVNDGFGEQWELVKNAFKPYPCGIVSHPAIDAAVAAAARIDDAHAIEGVTVLCHPLVVELTGNPDPKDGLEARFSTIHGVCAGLADGIVGLPQYTDDRVRDDDLIHLRSITRLQVDEEMARDAATVEVALSDGAVVREEVAHARGSIDRPLTDDELHDKLRGLVEPVHLGGADPIADAVQQLSSADSLDALVAATGAATPPEVGR